MLKATRSVDGKSANISVSPKVAFKDLPKAAVGIGADGEKIALYVRHRGALMLQRYSVCLGSVSNDGSFNDKSCDQFSAHLEPSLRSLDGHISTSFWDASRNRLV